MYDKGIKIGDPVLAFNTSPAILVSIVPCEGVEDCPLDKRSCGKKQYVIARENGKLIGLCKDDIFRADKYELEYKLTCRYCGQPMKYKKNDVWVCPCGTAAGLIWNKQEKKEKKNGKKSRK